MTRIVVIGGRGKMGARICAFARMDTTITITGVTEMKGSSAIGQPVFPDGDERYRSLVISQNIEDVLSAADVVIDFTVPAATMATLPAIVSARKAVVIGTTGLSDEQRKKIADAGTHIPIVFSPNMSIGVNVFFKIIAQAAQYLKGYDVEIIEMHHNQKKDSPSGTAVKLGEIISNVRCITKKDWKHGREGDVGARTPSELGMHAVRLGDVVGEHRVMFAGNSELLEFTHRAHTRDNFAKGALTAAPWIVGKTPGVYDMQDVLGLQ